METMKWILGDTEKKTRVSHRANTSSRRQNERMG